MDLESDTLIIISAFFYITIINVLPSAIMAMGEEIGWHGFLVPELAEWAGLNYGQTGTPLWFRLTCFTILVISTGVLLAWLRIKSGLITKHVAKLLTKEGVIIYHIFLLFSRLRFHISLRLWSSGFIIILF